MEIDYTKIKVIGFDADDTLWVNETYFREAEAAAGKLLSLYETPNKIDQELFKMEIKNLPTYGYGVKGFILSMIELAIELSNGTVANDVIAQMLKIGKDMINKPIELLDGVEEVLKELSKDYRLIVATKGDLLDQERKLEKSGLLKYFHHIEVLSEKEASNYSKLLKHLDIEPEAFLSLVKRSHAELSDSVSALRKEVSGLGFTEFNVYEIPEMPFSAILASYRDDGLFAVIYDSGNTAHYDLIAKSSQGNIFTISNSANDYRALSGGHVYKKILPIRNDFSEALEFLRTEKTEELQILQVADFEGLLLQSYQA